MIPQTWDGAMDRLDRRHEDAHLLRLETKMDNADKRFDSHESAEFERYDRMIQASEASLALAQKALTVAEANNARLEGLCNRLEEPLAFYETSKAGIVVIKTSGNVVKFLAVTGAATAAVWAAITHLGGK